MIPVVVITACAAISSVEKALELINCFAGVDDVYSQSFARTVVLQATIESDPTELLSQFKASGRFTAVYHTTSSSPSDTLPPGPYFLSRGSIYQAYRLYEDEL